MTSQSEAAHILMEGHQGDVENNSAIAYEHATEGDVIVIDPRGDMHMIVTSVKGGEVRKFRVHSACIRLASEQWASLLDHTSKTEGSPKDIYISEDHQNVLYYVLQTAHHQDHRIASQPKFEELVQLAALCRVHGLLRLFSRSIRSLILPWLRKLLTPGFEMWLVIAYEFGMQDIYHHLLDHYSAIMYKKDGGSFLNDVRVTDSQLSQATIAHLTDLRIKHIQHVIDGCWALIEQYTIGKIDCTKTKDGIECANNSLGSLLRMLHDQGIFPNRPKAEDMDESPNALRQRLTKTPIRDHQHSSKSSTLAVQYSLVERICGWETRRDFSKSITIDWSHVAHLDPSLIIATHDPWLPAPQSIAGFPNLDNSFYLLGHEDDCEVDSDYEVEDISEPPEEFTIEGDEYECCCTTDSDSDMEDGDEVEEDSDMEGICGSEVCYAPRGDKSEERDSDYTGDKPGGVRD